MQPVLETGPSTKSTLHMDAYLDRVRFLLTPGLLLIR